ncbi:MAG TPA: efflux RND transporter periplasmic adaptor subunit [Nitrospiria bacterium]|nr:efflux RND transporter periplasmic adaptor subunit [Nitrospiria bacterium]HUK55158.1 efflux RND transporter periplasmic adaptor subunit [Nitrospiria bacterium]
MGRPSSVFQTVGVSCRIGPLFPRTATAFLAVAVFLSACSGQSSGQTPKKDAKGAPAVPVLVSPVVQKPMPVELRAIGNVQSYSTVVVKSLVEGTLTRAYFNEGQEVKQGALLFTIDARPFEVQLKQAEANLARDRAQAENARLEANRYEQLLQKQYVSQEQYEQLRANSGAYEGTLLADQAAVDQAKLQLDYCSIRSPVDGVAGTLLVYPGNLVKVDDPDHPLVTINQVRPIYVAFSVPEKDLSDIRRHRALGPLAVEAIVPNGKSPAAHGRLTFVDNAVNNTTGTIQLKALFPNEAETLWPGQFVNVVLTLTMQPDAVVVPSQAIQTGQQGSYVFVVKSDQTVESRPVVAAQEVNGETVINQGLAPGERVVTDGQLRLVSGVKVEIKTAPPGEMDPEKAPGKTP